MLKSMNHPFGPRLRLAALFIAVAPAAIAQEADGPQRFDTPDAASAALVQALEAKNVDGVVQILGPRYRDDLIPDDTADFEQGLSDVIDAAKAGVRLDGDGDHRTIVMGTAGWTFPVPLVQAEGAWRFDTEAGLDEIAARRIGGNELSAIEVAQAYGPAQMAYALKDRDGDGVLEYARRLLSTPGKHDGLYWPDEAGEDPSPFGPLVADDKTYFGSYQPGAPYHGYTFRILTRQEDGVPGGRYDYVINGNMIAGFALVAVPAVYGETGRTTFLVSHHGQIWQKDLGDRTEVLAAAIQSFAVDDSWDEVEP
ncbi:hypothetical protein E9232_000608 [Inquilinus ginsengisoli]|uniref:DUF2950 domain-containing protein n=1 Tax=Inquilinus ginsengisoli TaxID=363840 RepID=A0ABU1JKL7_9PROT|nr:DUF2950 domain-containing protein [Inquilinus ginsengisoli]MDR6288109.1 hypothetical protein [Inquilinus ginsengisoli]